MRLCSFWSRTFLIVVEKCRKPNGSTQCPNNSDRSCVFVSVSGRRPVMTFRWQVASLTQVFALQNSISEASVDTQIQFWTVDRICWGSVRWRSGSSGATLLMLPSASLWTSLKDSASCWICSSNSKTKKVWMSRHRTLVGQDTKYDRLCCYLQSEGNLIKNVI